MIRLTIFIIALLLAVGAVDPTKALLVTLAVLAGIELFCIRLPLFGLRRVRRWARGPRLEYDYD
jgi:hypothetical protein